jgi:LacI family transcriptional regulator
LNAYRVDRAAPRFHGTLGWLTCFPTPHGWREMIQAEGYFTGAREKAERLGYRLEEFWVAEPGLTTRRLTQILLARGVRGLIVAPLPQAHGEIPLEWKHFSAAVLGYSLARPQLHVVMNHQFRNMKNLVGHLHGLGYERIGFAMPAANDERVDHNYLSGYWIAQQGLPPGTPRPRPLLAENFDAPTFRKWFRQQSPDAIVVAASYAHTVIGWLSADGLRVPDDIGIAVASTPFGDATISGIDENVRMVGAMAVDTVVGMIHRNETGVPANPWRILAEGTWFQGRTVCERSRVAHVPSHP